MRNQRGITLIALVITIIVLLILAGVSIAMLTGQNGILTRADQAGTTTNEKSNSEIVKLAISNILTEYYAGNSTLNVTNTTGELRITQEGLEDAIQQVSPDADVTVGISESDSNLTVTFSNNQVIKVNPTTGAIASDSATTE